MRTKAAAPGNPGRPPKYPEEGGAQKGFLIKLTPLQEKRALAYGPTVSAGVNAMLRKFGAHITPESLRDDEIQAAVTHPPGIRTTGANGNSIDPCLAAADGAGDPD
jgi:hypothetical protein